MRQRSRFPIPPLLALVAGVSLIPSLSSIAQAQDEARRQLRLGTAAREQIVALLAEKESRSPAERKISSRLLYALKAQRGGPMVAAREIQTLRSAVAPLDDKGRVEVDIKGAVGKELIEAIEKSGGEVVYASGRAGSVRARLPLESLEDLAALSAVRTIRAADKVKTHGRPAGAGRIDIGQRAANVAAQLAQARPLRAPVPLPAEAPHPNVGTATSEGDTAHRAAEARNFFGVTGAGVKIGVLSDSVDFLADSIATGDLPPDVTVLPGQSGVPGSGEGTAMLEIVHDLAPGAKLFFATAFISPESFADNIRALRAAGCDIIVDDVIWSNESPFHDDIVSTAVEEVIADGALYFSSAGNEGNFNDGTSSVWEGDFKDSGRTLASLPGGTLHDFGSGVISNRAESSSGFILGLYWSDPLGASGNDYDLFIMNSTLTVLFDASTDVQDGDDDPLESTFPGAFAGERVLVFKKTGAQPRALHVNNFGGQFGIATTGSTHGHNSVGAGFGVAAVDVAVAGGGQFTGGPTNPVELFSSDGPRRVFFRSNGSAFTPGKFLFGNGGGQLRRKPSLTAADGVSTTVPGFSAFFGTSAAAPHAAAIAALVKAARPAITGTGMQVVLALSALDIEATGLDRDSGAGIANAYRALQIIGAPPSPLLELGAVTTTAVGGDGDAFVEPGEDGEITVGLVNVGGATALAVQSTVATSTPGVTLTNASSTYPNIGSNGQSEDNNTPYAFTLDSSAMCGLAVDFTQTVTYANSNVGPQEFAFTVQTGQPGAGSTTTSFTGPPAPIPDNNPDGVSVPLELSGFTGAISDLNFSFDGTSCTNASGATTVGLDHTWVGDLVATLTSPQGTTVTLMNRPGGALNSGNNFCNTVLDDDATNSIQNIASSGTPPNGPPYTGTFKPTNPLAAFNGEDANGTWTLNVRDGATLDVGSVRAFSLVISTFECTP